MSDYNSLLIIIVDFLRNFKAYQLKSICEKYGINCDSSLNPMHSKRVYIEGGIIKKSFAELKEIAKQIISLIVFGKCF